MKNDYYQMYKAYDSLLASEKAKSLDFAPAFKAQAFLAAQEKARMLSILKSKLKDVRALLEKYPDLSLEEILDLNFVSKERLIKLLKELYQSASVEDKALISKLLGGLEEHYEQTPSASEAAQQEDAVASQSLTHPFVGSELPDHLRKYYNYRLFAFNKLKDESYFPTTAPKTIKNGLDNLPQEELQELYRPEHFYSLNKDQVLELLQATASEYMRSKGVEPCAVVPMDLPLSKNRVTFGEYDPNRGCIELNQGILDKFDEAKKSGNSYYIYNLLTTLIHEAQHRCQFANLNSEFQFGISQDIAKSLRQPQADMSYSQYLGSLDEIDARNASFEYIKNMALAQDNDSLKAFYNSQIDAEMANGKAPIPKQYEASFRSVYGASHLSCHSSTDRSQAAYYDILFGRRSRSSTSQPGED